MSRRYRNNFRDWGGFTPSRPREAKGGIKAQTQRGSFGQQWWSKRWIQILESFNIGARLSRGRSYARQGQVLSITIEKGEVTAKVQGSSHTPYSIKIAVNQLTESDWQKVLEYFSSQPIFLAKLSAGEMPQEVETVFLNLELSLFPGKMKDLVTKCSCPDWSNPCKHIAAVFYLLGEEFDRDPFLIFKMRGMSREELLQSLSAVAPDSEKQDHLALKQAVFPPQPLTNDFSLFWKGEELPGDFWGELKIPPVSAALPKQLGSFPFWRAEKHFLTAMEEFYTQSSDYTINEIMTK